MADNRARTHVDSGAELLITGGTILTVDRRRPRAQAILVRGGRIVEVGDHHAVAKAAGRDTVRLDLNGRTLLPGFADCHLHLASLGARQRSVDLQSLCKSEILERLAEHERSLRPGEPLVAYDWDFPSVPDPHRSDLDALFGDRPVVLFQFSGHGAWLNSAGLKLLGVSSTRDSWGMGGAERDSCGELSGVVREPAQAPRAKRFYLQRDLDRKTIRADLIEAMKQVSSVGITTAHDNTWFPWTLSIIGDLHREGQMPVRLSCWSPGFILPFDLWFSAKNFNPDWYRRGPRKYFLDGAFSSHSAWLSEPYADLPDTRGRGTPAQKIAGYLRRANRQHRQIACHSIGDASTAAYLSAAESVEPELCGMLRHRIEHAQLLRPADLERIARLGMVVSAQPHAAVDPEKDLGLLGGERASRAYPYRSILDAGIHLAFGSDFPGERSFAPLEGIHLAANRAGGEAITPEEAIECYTAGSAWSEYAEDRKGQIKEGYLADLAVLSADPTSVPCESIREIKVDATFVDGRLVYEREGAEIERSHSQLRPAVG